MKTSNIKEKSNIFKKSKEPFKEIPLKILHEKLVSKFDMKV